MRTNQLGGRAVLRCLRLVAVVAGIVLLAQGCGRRAEPSAPGPSAKSSLPTSPKPSPPGPRASIELGQIIVSDPTGKRLWRASAQSIDWDYDKQQAVLRDVQCQFTENNKLALEARAPLVTAYIRARRVELEGGVTARAPATKTSLRADRVQWDLRDKEVYATGNVKYVRDNIALSGPRLRADLSLKRARIEGGVQMQAVEPARTP